MDDPREAKRLEMKVDPVAWVNRYVADRVAPGFEVLSVGCGPGLMLREITKLDPSIRGTGIDISSSRVQAAKQKNAGNRQLKFICGDAQEMQFARNSFDFVYSRMLFQYLQKKEQALDELVRVCKPGGTVLLQDLDGQLLWNYPEERELQRALEQVVGALSKTGFDPFVGRKLFRLAQRSGLENLKVQVECYHLIAGEPSPKILEEWKLKLDIALPQIVQALGNERQAREQVQRFIEYLSRPDTLTYSNVFTVTGEKPLLESYRTKPQGND
ncbi:MAG TPA: methyltransferase domain-containing protein [Terriglobales bacterium]|nr:methyltransferase domain-containing protein [Terriglobales bacterium]